MKQFDLQLKITNYGSILSETVFLEDATDPYMEVKNWVSSDGFRYVQLSDYTISDNTLEVFLACRGASGGKTYVEVIINGVAKGKLTAKAEDTSYKSKSFNI